MQWLRLPVKAKGCKWVTCRYPGGREVSSGRIRSSDRDEDGLVGNRDRLAFLMGLGSLRSDLDCNGAVGLSDWRRLGRVFGARAP